MSGVAPPQALEKRMLGGLALEHDLWRVTTLIPDGDDRGPALLEEDRPAASCCLAQTRSKRSFSMTLTHAAAKSLTNFSDASADA